LILFIFKKIFNNSCTESLNIMKPLQCTLTQPGLSNGIKNTTRKGMWSRNLNMTQTKQINKQTTFLNRYIAKLHLNVIISLEENQSNLMQFPCFTLSNNIKVWVGDYVVFFLIKLYGIIFCWWSYTHNIDRNVCWTWIFLLLTSSPTR
jgi:hypothetical protein